MNIHGLKLRLNKIRKESKQIELELNKEYRKRPKNWLEIERLNNRLKIDLRRMEWNRKLINNLRKKNGRK